MTNDGDHLLEEEQHRRKAQKQEKEEAHGYDAPHLDGEPPVRVKEGIEPEGQAAPRGVQKLIERKRNERDDDYDQPEALADYRAFDVPRLKRGVHHERRNERVKERLDKVHSGI